MDDIPATYNQISQDELLARIAGRKDELGSRLCILGHHYQHDEVIQFADFRGDSLKLSQLAAETDAEFIVFCGVHFMAESAAILAGPSQTVCLPNLRAGCAMAEMADAAATAAAMDELAAMTDERILPVVYVNSTADVKALAGAAGGACCTSSNVENVFAWALGPGGGRKIFASPDQHLARNTAAAMGYPPEAVVVYDPHLPDGGLSADEVRAATFIVWQGFCYVHQIFTPAHVQAMRQRDPEIRVIVHPECPREVVELADEAGSTSQILQTIANAPAGSKWAVGTECHFVRRLAAEHPDKTVLELSDTPAGCVQMGRIDLPHLLWCLDAIAAGAPVNVVTVPPAIAADARLALERMIETKAVRRD